MKLDELSFGQVYIDTNILYMYLRADPEHLPIIKAFLKRVIAGEIAAYIGVPVLDELFYRLLLARVKDSTGQNPLNSLRQDLVGVLEDHAEPIRDTIQQFLSLPNINVVGVEATDGDSMMANILTYKLLPRDALHLAIMQRLDLNVVASDDTDFDRVAGFSRLWAINPT
jgi:predicted nucleic acid-binding protein